MTVITIAPGLAEQLRQEYEGYCALEDVLEREEAALVAAESDRVATLAGEKERLSLHLRDLGTRRIAYMQAQGLSGNAAGIQDWLARHPEQAEKTGAAWELLSSKAETTRRRNMSNGRLINALIQHLQARLNLISAANCANPTYGPDGFPKVLRFPSAFGQA